MLGRNSRRYDESTRKKKPEALDYYFEECPPLLSADEERALAIRIEQARADLENRTYTLLTKVLLADARTRDEYLRKTMQETAQLYKSSNKKEAKEKHALTLQHLQELKRNCSSYHAQDLEEKSGCFFAARHHLRKAYDTPDAISFLETLAAQPKAKDREEFFAPFQQASRRYTRERNALAEANVRLVSFVAKQFRWSGVELEELISEGHFGLLRAIETYDYRLGRFTTYASEWIWQAIQRGICNTQKNIRIPVHLAARQRKISKTAQWLEPRLGRELTAEDERLLAAEAQLTVKELRECRTLPKQPLSLAAPYGKERTIADVADQVSVKRYGGDAEDSEEAAIRNSLRGNVISKVEELVAEGEVKPRDRDIFLRYYFDPAEPSLEQIAGTLESRWKKGCSLTRAAVNKTTKNVAAKILEKYGIPIGTFLKKRPPQKMKLPEAPTGYLHVGDPAVKELTGLSAIGTIRDYFDTNGGPLITQQLPRPRGGRSFVYVERQSLEEFGRSRKKRL